MTSQTQYSSYTQENTDIQEFSLASLGEQDWLSHQFDRVPFLLYKYWLILNLPLILIFEYQTIYGGPSGSSLLILSRVKAFQAVSFAFSFYGCLQMLYAMKKKKSKIAQESFVKFQYALISSALGLVIPFIDKDEKGNWITYYGDLSAMIHFIGGFAVLQVFKRNHPLARLNALKGSEEENQDFLEQNEVIALEFVKYDKQLNKWPYFLYFCLLKFIVVAEIFFIFRFILRYTWTLWTSAHRKGEPVSSQFSIFIGLLIVSVLSVCSYFYMEIAARTKVLQKAKRALVLLLICVVVAVIKFFYVKKYVEFYVMFEGKEIWWWFYGSISAPLLCLIGAWKVKKIIEERDQFVKASSYSEDLYL